MDNDQVKQQIIQLFFLPAKTLWLAVIILGASAWFLLPSLADEAPTLHQIDYEAALNLSAIQQQKLRALESASLAQSSQLLLQIQQTRQKISDIYSSYVFDVAETRRLNQDLNRVQGLLLDLRLSEQLQLRQILTPDQFSQLQAAMNKHHFPNGNHHEGPGNGPPSSHPHGNHSWGFHPK